MIRASDTNRAVVAALVTVLGAGLVYLAWQAAALGESSALGLLTGILLVQSAIEVRQVRRLLPSRWVTNPVVVCTFMTFVLGYGATNVLYFLPENLIAMVGLPPEITPAMIKLMLYVVFGSAAMWVGFWCPIGVRLSKRTSLLSYFRYNVSQFGWVLPGLVVIGSICLLIQIRLGLFGYSSDYDRLIQYAAYTQYLGMGASLGKLALLVAAFEYFSTQRRQGAGVWLFVVLALNMFAGFLSGFKSEVVMPLIIVALCSYLRTGRFPRYLVLGVPLAVFVAFAVIEPFRVMRNSDVDFSGTSVSGIFHTLSSARSASPIDVQADSRAPLILSIMARFNFTYVGSLGIAYAEENSELPEDSPKFLLDIVRAPLLAWIPRLFWPDKPLGNVGLWYNHVVVGHETMSSTAMGPFTYLNFAGGAAAILLGFFAVGIAQRLLVLVTQPDISIPGGLVFLNMLGTLAIIDSSFNSIPVIFCRDLPIILILQSILYRRPTPIEVSADG